MGQIGCDVVSKITLSLLISVIISHFKYESTRDARPNLVSYETVSSSYLHQRARYGPSRVSSQQINNLMRKWTPDYK